MTSVWEKYEKILQRSPLFSDLSPVETESALLSMQAKQSRYRKGEFLHTPFAPFSQFALVLAGTVNVCVDDFGGNRMIMATVTPGVTFGESLCYLCAAEPPVYAYASEDCEVLWLTPPQSADGNLAQRFTAMLAGKALSMNTRIQILSKLTLREKIITFFSSFPASERKSGITLSLSREDMAAYLGTNRSALSRELSKMQRDGLLIYHKNVFRIL